MPAAERFDGRVDFVLAGVDQRGVIKMSGSVGKMENIKIVEDRLADFTRDKRVLVLSWMALIIGAFSAVVAYMLVWLIAVITNLAFYQTFSSVFNRRIIIV